MGIRILGQKTTAKSTLGARPPQERAPGMEMGARPLEMMFKYVFYPCCLAAGLSLFA
jgi:hypothetical protein